MKKKNNNTSVHEIPKFSELATISTLLTHTGYMLMFSSTHAKYGLCIQKQEQFFDSNEWICAVGYNLKG